MYNDLERILISLSKSKFRSSFHLNKKMKQYVKDKGLDKVEMHAYDFVNKRLKPKILKNDGKQTPMRQTHPVFVAQHATATCCRNCLYKWHKIEKNKQLTENEVNYIVKVIMKWIKSEI